MLIIFQCNTYVKNTALHRFKQLMLIKWYTLFNAYSAYFESRTY